MRPSRFFRVCLFLLASTYPGIATLGDAAAAEIEPFEARVTKPRALVFSGPGEKFYPTSALSPGDLVEVYREEPGGWLGIRPPQGSFSLVSDQEVTASAGDVAEIKHDDVSSRVGSRLSDRHNAVQVRLKKGEVVAVLGQESIGNEKYSKIAPPAGEFRWIQAASVERVRPISKTPPPAEDVQVVPTGGTSASAAPKADESAATASTPTVSSPSGNEESWRASTAPVSAPTADPTPAATPVPAAPPLTPIADPSPASVPSSGAPAAPVATASAAAPAAPVTPTEFDLPRRLTDIELRLSRMASAPPQLWNTERLQRDAEQLLAQAKTGAERDSVKLTMGKIDQFTALTRRYQQQSGRGGEGESGRMVTNQVSPSPRLPVSPSGYDAVGILRPVVSKRPGAPQFALVDERGQVVTLVTPTPDVNLQPYLGRRVGIAGNRGFIPEFNRAHVTAGRVTPLVR